MTTTADTANLEVERMISEAIFAAFNWPQQHNIHSSTISVAYVYLSIVSVFYNPKYVYNETKPLFLCTGCTGRKQGEVIQVKTWHISETREYNFGLIEALQIDINCLHEARELVLVRRLAEEILVIAFALKFIKPKRHFDSNVPHNTGKILLGIQPCIVAFRIADEHYRTQRAHAFLKWFFSACNTSLNDLS